MDFLFHQYKHPVNYISFISKEIDQVENQFKGFIRFTDDEGVTSEQSPGGYVDINAQVDTEKSVFEQSPINPFFAIPLTTVEFRSVLIQGEQVFVNNYEKQISLVPNSPGMHLP